MEYPKLLKDQTIVDKFDPNSGLNDIEGKQKDTGRWRDLTAFWILGLCNDYGYTVMLSAAHDIINRHSEVSTHQFPFQSIIFIFLKLSIL